MRFCNSLILQKSSAHAVHAVTPEHTSFESKKEQKLLCTGGELRDFGGVFYWW